MKHTKQTQSILGAAIAARRIHGPYRYAFRDAWDLDTTAMAAAWGWSRDRVRREAPCIVTDALMFTSGSAWRARLHYRLAWHLGRLLGLLRLALRRLAGR